MSICVQMYVLQDGTGESIHSCVCVHMCMCIHMCVDVHGAWKKEKLHRPEVKSSYCFSGAAQVPH